MSKKKIISYIVDGVLILIIALLGYVQISMLTNKRFGVPVVFGKSFLYVATDSMDDKTKGCYAPGTGIIIEKVGHKGMMNLKLSTPIYEDPSDPESKIIGYNNDGSVVTFALDLTNQTVPDTHRLINREVDENGKIWFTTMGDKYRLDPDESGKFNFDKPWSEDKFIGKVVYHSKALGSFLTIASPSAAASVGKKAWFFPVAIVTPIVILAGMYIVDAFRKYHKEEKEREAKINAAMEKAGVDMNDEEAVELFRMKEEIRLDYQEEFEKMKKEIRKELEKKKDEE